jgi:hypothetical protein
VDVVVYTSDGAAYRSSLDLELGQATLEMTTAGRPERAVLDPDLRWYARRDRAALHVQEQS